MDDDDADYMQGSDEEVRFAASKISVATAHRVHRTTALTILTETIMMLKSLAAPM